MTMKWMILLALLLPATASAQTAVTNTWTHGTTLEVFSGRAVTPRTLDSYGGAFGWELTHRFEIQGLGAWFPQKGSDEFAADLKLLMNLTAPSLLVPYVAGGAGLFQGAFERTRVETDPTALVAAGAHLYVRRHLSLRPEGTVRFAIDGSKTHRVTTITLAVTYHFEEHEGM